MSKRLQIIRQGKVESDSRNLRGLMDYARRNTIQRVTLEMTEDYGALFHVRFVNGATLNTEFAGWDVAQRWVRARRSWSLKAAVIKATFEAWELSE